MTTFPSNSIVRITSIYRKMLENEISNNQVDDSVYYQEFLDSHNFIFMGQVHLRKDCGLFASYSGKIYWPFLLENFELVPENEL